MNRKQMEHWERQRARGRLRYVLVFGVLGFGLLTMVSSTLIEFLIGHEPGASLIPEGRALLPFLVSRLLTVALAGTGWGLVMWRLAEREYRKALRRSDT